MRERSLLFLLIPLVVVATLIAWLVWPDDGQDARPATRRPGYVVSYAGMAHQLVGLDESEATEQVRDWARVGLATRLGPDTTDLVDAFYDTLPLRD